MGYNTLMDSVFNFQQLEDKIYQLWEKSDAFKPDLGRKKSFCIIMPPPNANDPLHIGHAMFVSLEDALIRYHRLKGEAALWQPGGDHAGIETQFVFEKKLSKEGKSRFDYDRHTLYQMIWDYVQKNSDVAISQMKKMGASADWSRYKFTLDPKIVDIVLDTFLDLFKKKLIYKDLKLVNFCTKCGTSFSELEVVHQEQNSLLYSIRYGPLVVATTRPETIFADIALAVNPQDQRYQQYVGQKIVAHFPWGDQEVSIIADDYVKMDFGTGVLKITPYHDHNDYEVWQRHLAELPAPHAVINTRGKMETVPLDYLNLNINQAREKVLAALDQAGLLVEKKAHLNSVGSCYRCGRSIEPLPLPQFFVKVAPLVKPVLAALKEKKIKIFGAGQDKILRHWLKTLKDWNISRQIVWGIRLPVYYPIAGNEDKILVNFINQQGEKINGLLSLLLSTYSINEISKGIQSINVDKSVLAIASKTTLDPQKYLQELDTLDTWFSSSQWPFATLMSNSESDFNRFYPSSIMETGYDILMFWVMRMLLIGQMKTGKLPFKSIYLHGLIRDSKGQKMSKSKGNVVNPLEVIAKYGSDALRMALVIRSSPGLDKNVSEQDFKAMRNLANKIWNASRFVLQMQSDSHAATNKKFTQKLNQVIADVTTQLDKNKLGLAADTVYDAFWHWFCDEAIEEAKKGKIAQNQLLIGLITFLKLLHPFAPFVTEAVWQELKKQNLVSEDLLIASTWPTVSQ